VRILLIVLDRERMHAFREQGGLDILVTQLLSPQPHIQLFAAHLIRSCASVGMSLHALCGMVTAS